jgi:hypothetical protein
MCCFEPVLVNYCARKIDLTVQRHTNIALLRASPTLRELPRLRPHQSHAPCACNSDTPALVYHAFNRRVKKDCGTPQTTPCFGISTPCRARVRRRRSYALLAGRRGPRTTYAPLHTLGGKGRRTHADRHRYPQGAFLVTAALPATKHLSPEKFGAPSASCKSSASPSPFSAYRPSPTKRRAPRY